MSMPFGGRCKPTMMWLVRPQKSSQPKPNTNTTISVQVSCPGSARQKVRGETVRRSRLAPDIVCRSEGRVAHDHWHTTPRLSTLQFTSEDGLSAGGTFQ